MKGDNEEWWDEWWDDDRKQHVTAFAKKLRSKNKSTATIPVYCSTSNQKASTLPNSIVVNVKSKIISRVPFTYPMPFNNLAVPVCYASSETITDMKALAHPLNKLVIAAVIFQNANPETVREMFRFYSEIEGDKPDPDTIRTLAKSSLDSKHPLIVLGRVVEAVKLLIAALNLEDTYPERSIVIEELAKLKKKNRVPYVILSEITIDMFKIKRPVLVVDLLKGNYVIKPKMLVPRRRYKYKTRTMSQFTYECLENLASAVLHPKMVVFVTDDAEWVAAIIDFYESMPDISNAYCVKRWKGLARALGASSFEHFCSE